MAKSRLERALLEVFLQAEAEGRRDTTEHLMRALEALCGGPDAACDPPLAPDEPDKAAGQLRPPDANQEPPRRSASAGQADDRLIDDQRIVAPPRPLP